MNLFAENRVAEEPPMGPMFSTDELCFPRVTFEVRAEQLGLSLDGAAPLPTCLIPRKVRVLLDLAPRGPTSYKVTMAVLSLGQLGYTENVSFSGLPDNQKLATWSWMYLPKGIKLERPPLWLAPHLGQRLDPGKSVIWITPGDNPSCALRLRAGGDGIRRLEIEPESLSGDWAWHPGRRLAFCIVSRN